MRGSSSAQNRANISILEAKEILPADHPLWRTQLIRDFLTAHEMKDTLWIILGSYDLDQNLVKGSWAYGDH